MLKKAQAIGISKRVLDEAKKELNVRSLKEGSQWYGEIPEKTEGGFSRLQYCKNWHPCNLAMFLFREVIKFGGECREHLFKGVLCPSESPRHLCNRQVESVIMGYAL